ncbi:hypothetical protein HYFRA_00013138 [Hymenoscyphus fraxineus]|uniref:Uncharacterized protein n=1 Tax=Hymenoscyphus fraxineus TaxID=746836 RepID=A0A9N9L7C1_9HELO|nr:hypothetical protein HYFRA_00013138 [Hymenoscyphus fraxineus]
MPPDLVVDRNPQTPTNNSIIHITMFEHFTFAAQAQSHCQNVEDVPPLDISLPSPVSSPILTPQSWNLPELQSPVDTIAHQFSTQSLSPSLHDEKSQTSLWYHPTSSPIIDSDSDHDHIHPSELTYISSTRGLTRVQAEFSSFPSSTSTNRTLACRRAQRQRNIQAQCSPKHMRDIQSLVSSMIESNSQCRLRKPTTIIYPNSPPPSRGGDSPYSDELTKSAEADIEMRCTFDRASSPEDEGFGDDDELVPVVREEVPSLRRCAVPGGIRKNGAVPVKGKKGREVSGVGSSCSRIVDGKAKIRCPPRMRRRCKVE